MAIVLVVAGALAVLMHVWIFVMESIRWEHPATRRVFGTSEADARQTSEMAYNQGFYNLFLAVILAAGLWLWLADDPAGPPLVVAGAGAMLGAALVLVTRSPTRMRAAVAQGLFPALTLVTLLLA